jgi:Nucleotide modification associated domain 3
MAAFLVNVGANAAHRVRSPLFADGSFLLLPIPEKRPWAPPMVRMPEVWGDRGVHLDPNLGAEPPTYGDNCRRAGRAFTLRRAQAGDRLFFLARLHAQGPQPAAAGFYLVGQLDVLEVLGDVTSDPGPGWWDGNAHVRRARAGAPWDSFWVFRGGPASRLFQTAVSFTRVEADRVFRRGWLWREARTELQTIGSYTRAVRRLEGPTEELLRSLCPS